MCLFVSARETWCQRSKRLPKHIPMMQQPVRGGERHQSPRLGFLRVGGGTIWQVASSRIATHSIALPILSTSATSNNHYLPPSLLCSMWAPHAEHHHRSQRSTPSSGKSNLLPPSPERSGSFRPNSWFEERQWDIDWGRWCTRRKTAPCARKTQFFKMTYMRLYTQHSHNTLPIQKFIARNTSVPARPPSLQLSSRSSKRQADPPSWPEGQKFALLLLLNRRECTERSGKGVIWKPVSCIIHCKTKPKPGGGAGSTVASHSHQETLWPR